MRAEEHRSHATTARRVKAVGWNTPPLATGIQRMPTCPAHKAGSYENYDETKPDAGGMPASDIAHRASCYRWPQSGCPRLLSIYL